MRITWHQISVASQVVLLIKDLPPNAGDSRDKGSIPGSGRSPGKGNVTPLQYSCLENSMEGGVSHATVHGVTKKSDTTSMAIHTER